MRKKKKRERQERELRRKKHEEEIRKKEIYTKWTRTGRKEGYFGRIRKMMKKEKGREKQETERRDKRNRTEEGEVVRQGRYCRSVEREIERGGAFIIG